MSQVSVAHGRAAEAAVAKFLVKRGYTLIAQNWRTRWCEIDVIVRKNQITALIEVKYRQTSRFGSGLDSITPQKLKQLYLAARFWQARSPFSHDEIRLIACEVSGRDYQKLQFIEL